MRWEDGLPPTLAYLKTLREKGPVEASRHRTTPRLVEEIPELRRR